MSTLLLRLAAPLQAWGSDSKFNIRSTQREPTKSGVVGMIASAMGIQRNDDPKKLEPLNALRFGVRVDREGKLLKDFHMVHEMTGKRDSHVTTRFYLSDAVFLAALESDDNEYLSQIAYALENPVYPLFLGRRSCPPTLPIVLGIRSGKLVDTLKTEPSLVDKVEPSRIVYDSDHGVTVCDKPISFSQLHRQYGFRMKKEEMLKKYEHDPMNDS